MAETYVFNIKEMTEEEADALDEYYTKNTIMPDMSRPGYFAGKGFVKVSRCLIKNIPRMIIFVEEYCNSNRDRFVPALSIIWQNLYR